MAEIPDKTKTETESKTRPKRHTTDAQKEASRRNGSRSRGPVTEQGKMQSKYNGLRHGMACQTPIVLPGEDGQLIEDKTFLWTYETGATSDLEITFVRSAAEAWHRGQRVLLADRAAITKTINEINTQYYDRKKAAVGPLIALLPDRPLEAQFQLLKSTAGCSYILEQFQLMYDQLATHSSLGPCQFMLALSLCGKHHRDLFRDGVIRDWARAHVASYHGDQNPVEVKSVCRLLHTDRPEHMETDEFFYDLERLVEKLPTRAEGTALLRRLIATQIREVTERRKLIAVSEKVEIELEVAKARTDVSRDGALRHRYLMDNDRAHRAAIRELRQVIQFRHKYGPDLEVDDEEVGVEMTRAGDPSGDLTGENRTEPGATQAAGVTDDPKADPAPSAAAATPEPGPRMAGPSEDLGPPSAERESTVEPRQPEVRSPNPTGENRTEPGATQVAGDPAVREAARRYLDQLYAALNRRDEAAARALLRTVDPAVNAAACDLVQESAGRPGARAGGVQDGPAGRRVPG
jgi:hypothetical protein